MKFLEKCTGISTCEKDTIVYTFSQDLTLPCLVTFNLMEAPIKISYFYFFGNGNFNISPFNPNTPLFSKVYDYFIEHKTHILVFPNTGCKRIDDSYTEAVKVELRKQKKQYTFTDEVFDIKSRALIKFFGSELDISDCLSYYFRDNQAKKGLSVVLNETIKNFYKKPILKFIDECRFTNMCILKQAIFN